jgi:quinol monooxygenase YgiN
MLVIAGTVRVPPENLPDLRPHMLVVLEASQAEDGCIVYSFAEDVQEPGLIRIFEAWRDRAALGAHGKTPHLAAWREAGKQHGVSDRRLSLYEVTGETPL